MGKNIKKAQEQCTIHSVSQSVSKAKKIISDIYSLTDKHKGGADLDLNKATDSMYQFIATIENK
jgi:flagellin-specific chaperone FliS